MGIRSDLESDVLHEEEDQRTMNTYNKVKTSDDYSETDNSTNQNEIANTGWVDSISKILKTKKPKKKRTVVLSKAKKLTDKRKTELKILEFEVETTDGEIKKDILEDISDTLSIKSTSKKKRDISNLRIKPNILERSRERTLQKIATKGVVQLFNAVKMQQKDISDKLKEAGPLEVKKDKVLKSFDKRAFLDVLMGEKSQNVEEYIQKQIPSRITENSQEKNSTWSVLKDDFMMTAKMKDWDKDLNETEAHI